MLGPFLTGKTPFLTGKTTHRSHVELYIKVVYKFQEKYCIQPKFTTNPLQIQDN